MGAQLTSLRFFCRRIANRNLVIALSLFDMMMGPEQLNVAEREGDLDARVA